MQAVAAMEPGAAFPPRVARLLGDAVAKAAEAGPQLLAGALRLDDASDTLFLLLCRQVLRLPMLVSSSAAGAFRQCSLCMFVSECVCVCVCWGGGGGSLSTESPPPPPLPPPPLPPPPPHGAAIFCPGARR